MTKTERIWLIIAILVALAGGATGAISYFFGIKVVSSGEAYGFRIGDSRVKTFEKAQALLRKKQIVEIHTWPAGAPHKPFNNNEDPEKNTDTRWVMVVDPSWWNNTISVAFSNNTVVEVRRDKIYCELP